MNEQLPPLPPIDDYLPTDGPRWTTVNFIACVKRYATDYARAALAAKVPADPHLMTKHNALHMNHIALKAHADRLARALHTGLGALICAGSNDECQSLEVYAKQVMREALVAYDAAAPAPEATELAKAHEARRQAQSEVAYLKARIAGARLILMRELKEQGWTPPAPAQAQQAASEAFEAGYEAAQADAELVAKKMERLREAKPEAQHPDTQDAERYRWLRDEHIGDDPGAISLRSGKTRGLDAAIDWQRIGASGEASNG